MNSARTTISATGVAIFFFMGVLNGVASSQEPTPGEATETDGTTETTETSQANQPGEID